MGSFVNVYIENERLREVELGFAVLGVLCIVVVALVICVPVDEGKGGTSGWVSYNFHFLASVDSCVMLHLY